MKGTGTKVERRKNTGDELIQVIIYKYMEMAQGNQCIALFFFWWYWG
jgi:hypothetical protein